MKLSKIYSNIPSFKSIEFNEGVNIIIGRIKHPNQKSSDHNIGKSMLVKIIDFLLLKDYNTGGFLGSELFKTYEFYLEVKLNDGKYVTIKRSPRDIKSVSILKHEQGKQNLINATEWQTYPIRGNSKNKEYGIEVFQELLNFNVFTDGKYRKLLGYFLRKQGDYNSAFQLQKFTKNKDSEWKPILFELLGYDKKLLDDIYFVTDRIKKITDEIIHIKEYFKVDEGALDGILNQKDVLEKRIEFLSEKAENFDFYLQEANISKELIENIEKEISELNITVYNVKGDIEAIRQSLKDEIVYNYEDVYELFNEVKLIFPDTLKHNYDDLLEFNRSITCDRAAKLQELLSLKIAIAQEMDNKLKVLNNKRVNALAKLQREETFQKFKDAQIEIIALNTKLDDVKHRIKAIEDISTKRKEKEAEKAKLSALREEIRDLITIGTERGTQIKLLFAKYFKDIVGGVARLVFELPKTEDSANIMFTTKTFDEHGNETQQSDGHTYQKEICACMDLAILTSYLDKSFFRFVLHDGILDGDDRRIASSYLDLIRKLGNNGLQCIITMIDSVVPMTTDGKKYALYDGEIVLELNDNPDGSGKLFGFNF